MPQALARFRTKREHEAFYTKKKAVPSSIIYFKSKRALTDEEVVNAHNKVLKAFAKQAGTEPIMLLPNDRKQT